MAAPSAEPEAPRPPRRRVVVGTAGHIDHGKTRLVEALTGIDCDRWAEEKERGITIDLGFAHLETPLPAGSATAGGAGTLQIGFVDVPGHERFLRNALAGLGGIRVMLLVVAADEGVKPQTREHLEICSLLGIPAALVALTKADLVDDDLLALARLEVEELLETTPFAGAPVMGVSSATGEGVAELAARLVELAAAQAADPETAPSAALPARLPVDRAFHLKGLGVIVTGTLAAGRIAVGDTLEVLPPARGDDPAAARVRSIQVHGEGRTETVAGERSALQLAGVDLAHIERGHQVAAPGGYAATQRLLADVELLPDAPEPGAGFTPVRVHLLASEVLGRMRPLPRPGSAAGEGSGSYLAPGERGAVEIRLREPVVAIAGDRVILRRPSPGATLGGGVVLDPAPRERKLAALATAAAELRPGGEPAILHWAAAAGADGIAASGLARRRGVPRERAASDLAALATAGKLLEVTSGGAGGAGGGSGREPRWVTPGTVRTLADTAAQVLARFFAADRLSRGMPKAEAVERIFLRGGAALADVYLDWLARHGAIVVRGDLVTLPGRQAELTGEESSLATAVLESFAAAGLEPASPAEIARALGAKPQIFDGVVRYLSERGKLVRLPGGLIIAAVAIAALRDELARSGWERFTVAQFKERFGLTRKWAIPLLEHLDSTGVTRRLGDERMIVGARRD